MDARTVLTAIEEQNRWRARREKILERLEAVKARKRAIQSELEEVKKQVAHLSSVLAELTTDSSAREASKTRLEQLR